MQSQRVTILEIGQLQERAARLIEELNADRGMALAAAANPVLALEELGFDLSPQVRAEVEERSRFKPPTIARRRKLQRAIFKAAGKSFAIDSPEALRRVLFEDLGLTPPSGSDSIPDTGLPHCAPAPAGTGQASADAEDPLESLIDAHPVIAPLLEYRRIEARSPRFASPERYEELRRGRISVPLSNFRARLSKKTKPRA